MGSSNRVIWTAEALKNVESIVNYLESKWSRTEVEEFAERLRHREQLLALFPQAFPKSDRGGGYRRSVLTRHIAIYYKIEERAIVIYSVFDTRQDPDKLNIF